MKSPKPKLWVDWATHKAAKYACENYHYSKCMPAGKTVKFGVWENDKFIGVVVFGLGANAAIANMYGKTAELARVALCSHETPVTRILKICIKKLKTLCPELNCLISYADLDRHQGQIYKAGNWTDEGVTIAKWIKIRGIPTHPRSIVAKYGTSSIDWLKKNVDPNAKRIETKGKRRFVLKLRATSKDSVVPSDQDGEGGAIPTVALQNE